MYAVLKYKHKKNLLSIFQYLHVLLEQLWGIERRFNQFPVYLQAICVRYKHLATETVMTVPTHMLNGLLKEAILQMCPVVICNIIANWPLKTLW